MDEEIKDVEETQDEVLAEETDEVEETEALADDETL